MKKILLAISALLLSVAGFAQEPEEVAIEGPHFEFEQMEYDFGDVSHKSKQIECEFRFVNDGTTPLVITKTLTSCSCVKVSYDKKPIMPGAKGVIKVIYEVNKKEPGIFYKVIEIYSNTPQKRTNLTIKGNAVEDKRR